MSSWRLPQRADDPVTGRRPAWHRYCTRVPHGRMASIAAVAVATALALASAVPAWAQAPPGRSETGTPAPPSPGRALRDESLISAAIFLSRPMAICWTRVPSMSQASLRPQRSISMIEARSWALRFGGQAMVNRAAAPALRASTYPRRTSAGPSADRCRHRAARGRTISRASTPRIVHFGPARPRARHFGPEVISPGSTLRI
jgi:hypothetical protein